jgi:DNA-binding CsgD family transcriptional regulator
MQSTAAMCRRKANARIKALCCLGLGGEAIMPALLRELHAYIPSHGNTFFWADESGALSNVYDENPESAAVGPLYIEEFYNRRECDVHSGFSSSMHRDMGVVNRDRAVTVEKPAFYRSELYNVIFRPLRYDDFLRLIVRDGGRAMGALQLWRAPGDPPFTAEEERRLAALEPFIAHALIAPGALDVPLADSGQSGLIIADGKGKPLYLSPEGRRLLFLANHPRIAPGQAPIEPALLPQAVVGICESLSEVFAGEPQASPPRYRHQNCWGSFVFSAYWLDMANAATTRIGITIRREEPLVLRLMRAADAIPLSRRQWQICLMMANGLSFSQIAAKLTISEHTVIAHGRSIYLKLDVHNRVELVNRLLSLP